MKGATGLAIAISLGIAAAILNGLYLSNKAKQVERVELIGIRSGVTLQPGSVFTEDQLEPVAMPKNAVDNLLEYAFLYSDLKTVVGMPVTRKYTEGELVLRQDLVTPRTELKLAPGDRAMWIPVDTRTFVPSLVNPGDYVSFLVPRSISAPVAPPVTEEGDPAAEMPVTTGPTETIGPFMVLSLGNRLGTSEALKSKGIPQMQENVMTVSVHMEGNELEPKAKKLWNLLQMSDFRRVGVLLHPAPERPGGRPGP